MYTYIQTYMHTYVHTYTHTHARTHTHTNTHTYCKYKYIYINTHTHAHTYMTEFAEGRQGPPGKEMALQGPGGPSESRFIQQVGLVFTSYDMHVSSSSNPQPFTEMTTTQNPTHYTLKPKP